MRPDPLKLVKLRKRLDQAAETLAQGRLEEALALYQGLCEEAGVRAEAWHGLGVVWVQQGKPEEAVAALERALVELAPEETGRRGAYLNDLGEALRLGGRLNEALAAFEAVLLLAPDRAQVLNNRGVVLAALGHEDAARASFEAAVETSPDFAPAYNNLGVMWAKAGAWEAALRNFETAVKLDPAFAEAQANYRDLVQAHPELLEASVARLAQDLERLRVTDPAKSVRLDVAGPLSGENGEEST